MPYGQYFAVGEETSYGTPATRNKFAKVMRGSQLQHRPNRERSAIISANTGGDPERNFDKGQWGTGKIIIPVSYDDGAGFKMLKHLLGAVGAPSGGGPFTHVFTRLVGNPTGGAVSSAVALSAELNYELPDAGPLQARLLAGARVASGTFAWNAEEEVVLDCDLIGKEQTQVVKTGSPTFPDLETYGATFAQATLTIGGTAFGAVCRGVDFTINNGYNPRIRLGSPFTQKPLREGVAELAGNLRLDWEATPSAKVLWDAMKANTSTEIIVTLTGGSYSITVRLPKCFFNESTLNPEEGELQPVDFPFLAYHDATHTAVKVTVVTPNATI